VADLNWTPSKHECFGGMNASSVEAVQERLADIIAEHQVAIPLAIESGSRAWGFPSPDSDYDCRFIFTRSRDAYLSPWQRRDVIETPLDDELDVNGWDLGKALKLLLKGNAVVVEWLMSPIAYRENAGFRHELLQFARVHADRAGIARHYLHLGERQRRTYFGDEKMIQLKKLFYALRPAAALRWLRLHPDATIPPMHFPTLIGEAEVPPELSATVTQLIERKAETRELGEGPVPKIIRDFIDAEFAAARDVFPEKSPPISPQSREAAEQHFRYWVDRLCNETAR
jgi:uncharacterized protein